MGVAVVKFHSGASSIMDGVTEESLKGFVEEHNRRYHAGEPGGPGGELAELVTQVLLFDEYDDTYDESKATSELDIVDLL